MKSTSTIKLAWVVALSCLIAYPDLAAARGGRGGGGRPSMGRVGGGGGRPSMGGGGRPSMGHSGGGGSRPNMSRPSMGHAGMGHGSRPNVSRPSGGNFHPSGGGRPSMPSSRPGGGAGNIANRPSVRPPSNVRPTLPGGGGNLAGGGRPSFDRPGAGTRPSFPGGNRPGGDQIANRPDFGNRPGPSFPGAGGNRPGGGDRPSFGNVTRPGGGGEGRPPIAGGGDRPNRPGGGGDRPTIGGGGNRPIRPGGGGEGRPPIAGGGDRPNRPGGGGDRPIIGGGGNRPGIDGRPGLRPDNIHIGDNNINVGNRVGNHPNWDNNNWNRPDWGWGGGGGWAGNWHDNCIRPHYGWYNGCWNGYWGSNWYAPLAWGAVGWGLGSLTSGWGYGSSYYNPYYSEAASVPYDYSQPVVVNNYAPADTATATADASAEPPEPAPDSPEAQATKLFDSGLAQFKSGDYRGALKNFDAALAKLPGDPVVHEVRAVTLFALGDYQASAAALNSFLSSAPGMDWTTMSSLYGNVDDYQAQLRKLEQFCQAHPKDSAAFFVLAYQYLVIGSKDSAVKALQVVVKNQPEDSTAKRMLSALAPATPPAPADVAAAPADSGGPETDLVGNWRAKAGDTTIDLAVTADSQFTWKATQKGKPPVQLSGALAAAGNELTLDSQKQGAMAGTVKSQGADRWQFVLDGAPASDPGLSFARVN